MQVCPRLFEICVYDGAEKEAASFLEHYKGACETADPVMNYRENLPATLFHHSIFKKLSSASDITQPKQTYFLKDSSIVVSPDEPQCGSHASRQT